MTVQGIIKRLYANMSSYDQDYHGHPYTAPYRDVSLLIEEYGRLEDECSETHARVWRLQERLADYTEDPVVRYERECISLTKSFIDKYFKGSTIEDGYFVADDPTGIFYISDMFFSIGSMYQYMRYDYSLGELHDNYDDGLESAMESRDFPSIKNWKKLKDIEQ